MPADHRDVERRDAAVLVGGVERDAPLELVPVRVEGVDNRQRVRALDDRAVLAQFHQEAERGFETGLAEEAPRAVWSSVSWPRLPQSSKARWSVTLIRCENDMGPPEADEGRARDGTNHSVGRRKAGEGSASGARGGWLKTCAADGARDDTRTYIPAFYSATMDRLNCRLSDRKFAALVITSLVATITIIPSGLGTFDATMLAILHLVGVSITHGVGAVSCSGGSR